MKVILVSGLWALGCPIWPNITRAFQKHLPWADYPVEERLILDANDSRKIHALTGSVVDKYRGNEELIVVGHSMGGVWACDIADALASQVMAVVTIFSPHAFTTRGKNLTMQTIVSFGGIRDQLVPAAATRHPQSTAHEDIDSDHLDDLVTNFELAEQIAATTMRHIIF